MGSRRQLDAREQTSVSAPRRREHLARRCRWYRAGETHWRITARGHVAELEDAGVDAILVGEALMRADDPSLVIRELLG